MYMILADYGYRCAFASHKKFKNILEAQSHKTLLEAGLKYLEIKYKEDTILKDITVEDIRYFVVHESEVDNELY